MKALWRRMAKHATWVVCCRLLAGGRVDAKAVAVLVRERLASVRRLKRQARLAGVRIATKPRITGIGERLDISARLRRDADGIRMTRRTSSADLTDFAGAAIAAADAEAGEARTRIRLRQRLSCPFGPIRKADLFCAAVRGEQRPDFVRIRAPEAGHRFIFDVDLTIGRGA